MAEAEEAVVEEEEEDPPLVVAVEEAAEAEEVEEAEDLPQPLALLCMATEDPMGASKATLPLSSMVTDPKASNS